jgi:sec-independent protein translocase protein TatC
MAASHAALRPPAPDEHDDSGGMSFLEHLEELRHRIIHALLGVAVGTIVSFAFIGSIFDFIFGPLNSLLPAGSRFIYTRPGAAFVIHIQLGMIGNRPSAAPRSIRRLCSREVMWDFRSRPVRDRHQSGHWSCVSTASGSP